MKFWKSIVGLSVLCGMASLTSARQTDSTEKATGAGEAKMATGAGYKGTAKNPTEQCLKNNGYLGQTHHPYYSAVLSHCTKNPDYKGL